MTKQKMSATSVILFALSAAYCVLMFVLLFSGPVDKITDMGKSKSTGMGCLLFFALTLFSIMLLNDLEEPLKKWCSLLAYPLITANAITMFVIIFHSSKVPQAFLAFGLPTILLLALFTYVDRTITNDGHSEYSIKTSNRTTAKPNPTQTAGAYRKHPARDWFRFIYPNG